MQQTLFLMLGYPGSGKTTAARILHEQTGAVHVWADHERKLRFVQPTYSHAENLKLYRQLNSEVGQLLAQGKSVIYDTNFNFYKDRQKLREIAGQCGARTIVVWVVAPKELARERATVGAESQHTRVLGDMPVEHWERIAAGLQPPYDGEVVIKLDGQQVTPENIAHALASLN